MSSAFEPFKKPNKYRRAFDWRVSSKDPAFKAQTVALTRLARSDFPDILEDFLETSRKRSGNRTALARLQAHMIQELLVQEGAVKHYRQKLKELRGDESSFDSGTPDHKTDAAESEFIQRELFFHRTFANAIRIIGDGIAWRTLGYDRAVTRLMSERATKQQIAVEGTIQELHEWSMQFDTGQGVAIFNAITNCLAVGDITLVRDDQSVEIIEVKSSKTKSSRTIRQKHKMAEVVTLLSAGEGLTKKSKSRSEYCLLTLKPDYKKLKRF